MRRPVGLILFLSGLALAIWIGYNLFIERKPQTADHNPMPGVIVSLCFMAFGFLWMKR